MHAVRYVNELKNMKKMQQGFSFIGGTGHRDCGGWVTGCRRFAPFS
ncbi:MSHA pilin protein MshB [Vibrio cholerae]|nr:MSHA pilin protein MshB [Vibrio cholerae]